MNALAYAALKGGHTCVDRAPLTWVEKVAYLGYLIGKPKVGAAPLSHIFEGDQYIREIYIPKGCYFLGRRHITGHLCELLSGRVLHIREEGRTEVAAPFRLTTTPGYHMVFFTITDVVGRTYHPNPEGLTDVKVLEDRIFAPADELFALGEKVAERARALDLRLDNLLGYIL